MTLTGILQNLVSLNANINRTTSISSMANNKAISKTLFIVPNDAHYYEITEKLKQFTNLKL